MVKRVRGHRIWPWAVSLLLGALAVAFGFRFGGDLALTLALAEPRSEAWLPRLSPEPVREDVLIDAGSTTLRADLYRPSRPRGAILMVHGLSPAGRRHPDLARLARLLARGGKLVLVPEFEGLAALRLSGREVEEVRAALIHLGHLSDRMGVIGLSFGAGPALIAAADVPGLRLVASFGGYADLRDVIAYVTTGVHHFGGRRWTQAQQEYNRWKLLSLLVGFVEDERERAALDAVARAKLADPGAPTQALEAALGADGRAMLAIALNRREEEVGPLLDRLSPGAREALDRLSPLAAVQRLTAPLVIVHGVGDDSIPFSEALRLAAAARAPARVALFSTFHHTGPAPLWTSLRDRAVDAWSLLAIADEVLSR
jgi:dienelactone hydrolase